MHSTRVEQGGDSLGALKKSILPLFGLLVIACTRIAEEPKDSIIKSTATYLEWPADQNDLSVVVEKVETDFARALVISRTDALDPATVYLKKTGGVWQVLVIGTGFSPDDYKELGIPTAVQ